jgi:DDE superfamily endonuclease
VYIDETRIDDEMLIDYGYSVKGVCIQTQISAVKHNRTSVIGSCSKKYETSKTCITSSMLVKGTTNGDTSLTYLERVLIPILTECQCVILDNTRIHKSTKVKALIEEAGCRMLYLPLYSPDFNPIEHLWSVLKKNLRTHNTTKGELHLG